MSITFTFKLLASCIQSQGGRYCGVRQVHFLLPSLLYLIHGWSTIVKPCYSDSRAAQQSESRAPGQLIYRYAVTANKEKMERTWINWLRWIRIRLFASQGLAASGIHFKRPSAPRLFLPTAMNWISRRPCYFKCASVLASLVFHVCSVSNRVSMSLKRWRFLSLLYAHLLGRWTPFPMTDVTSETEALLAVLSTAGSQMWVLDPPNIHASLWTLNIFTDKNPCSIATKVLT